MIIKLTGGPYDGDEYDIAFYSPVLYRPKNYSGVVAPSENIGSYSEYKEIDNGCYGFTKSVNTVENTPDISANDVNLTNEEIDILIKVATYTFFQESANKCGLDGIFRPDIDSLKFEFITIMLKLAQSAPSKDQSKILSSLYKKLHDRFEQIKGLS